MLKRRGLKNQLDMVTEDLNTQHEETIQHVLADISERQQEWRDKQFVEAFALGRTTRIQEECEYRDSVCKNQIDVGIQVRPTTATASVQTNSPIIPQSSALISTQTEPTLLSENVSESSPVPISKSPIPANSDSAPFNWASDSILLSTLPMIPSNQPHDLSSLHSSSKNPFSSLHHRHHYSKCPQLFSSQRYTQFHPTHPPLHQTPPFPLDWHCDPCLFELSHVLRSLGWSHS